MHMRPAAGILSMNRKSRVRVKPARPPHEPGSRPAAFTPLQLPMLPELSTFKRRKSCAPVRGFTRVFRGIRTSTLLIVLTLTAGFPAAAQITSTTNTAGAAAPVVATGVENSVVKIFSTMRYPDPYRPWTKESPTDATGTGVVIRGKRILTNAHVVNYASQIQIQANQAGDKISATVEAIAPGIDLAVLKLDDGKFFDTHPPLARAKSLPGIKDVVQIGRAHV